MEDHNYNKVVKKYGVSQGRKRLTFPYARLRGDDIIESGQSTIEGYYYFLDNNTCCVL